MYPRSPPPATSSNVENEKIKRPNNTGQGMCAGQVRAFTVVHIYQWQSRLTLRVYLRCSHISHISGILRDVPLPLAAVTFNNEGCVQRTLGWI
eukprot:4849942-Amphidinium_carterae.1